MAKNKLANIPSNLLRHGKYLVNGEWKHAAQTYAITDPSTGATLSDAAHCTVDETTDAIGAASQAQASFARLAAPERAGMLTRLHRLILDNAEPLAQILSAEQGKPLSEARGEIAYGASYIDFFAGEALRVNGMTVPSVVTGRTTMVLRQPVGVCGFITPWNFPNGMAARKLAAALAAGCASVLRPAEETPLSALAFAELAMQAGVPAGVVNVVTSDRDRASSIGQALCNDERVRKISFTGSTMVGKILLAQSATTVKRVSMELGGNAPVVVFDDADLDVAVAGAIACKFRNAGQTCISANRIFVHRKIAEEFAQRLSAATSKLVVGDGFAPATTVGPLINARAVDKVAAHVADAVERGARVRCGGERLAGTHTFYVPTVVDGCHDAMRVSTEETFGPVSALFTFDDEAEVYARANATPWGLAAYVFTRDLGRTMRASEALSFGMVGVNTGVIGSPLAPFGGVKESGSGREGSVLGIHDYLDVKAVHIQHS